LKEKRRIWEMVRIPRTNLEMETGKDGRPEIEKKGNATDSNSIAPENEVVISQLQPPDDSYNKAAPVHAPPGKPLRNFFSFRF
jgi:hypothetical protein